MSKYSQGVCADGAAILRDGHPMTVDEIVSALNRADLATEREKRLVEALKAARQCIYNGEAFPIGWNLSRIDEALATHESHKGGGS